MLANAELHRTASAANLCTGAIAMFEAIGQMSHDEGARMAATLMQSVLRVNAAAATP
jgi:hypothetical protein